MDKNNVVSTEIVRRITRMVVEELQKQQRLERSTQIGRASCRERVCPYV